MHREGDIHVGVRALLEFLEAPDAADEVDAGVCAGVGDLEDRGDEVVLQDRDVQGRDRVALVERAVTGDEPVPLPVIVHADVPGALGVEGTVHLLHVEVDADVGEQFGAGLALGKFRDTVVVHDLEVGGGEGDGEEEVELLVSGVVRVLLALVLTNADSGCTAVVAVSDVEGLDVLKQGAQISGDLRVADDPAAGVDLVLGREVVDRSLGFFQPFDDGGDVFLFPVGEEDGAGVRVAGRNVFDAVDLFGRQRVLMFLDDGVQIVIDGGAADETGLRATLPGLLHNVEAGDLVLQEHTVRLHVAEFGRGALVHGVVILVGASRQVDLGLVDVQERIGLVLDILTGLFTAVDVIGERCDFVGELCGGAYGPERTEGGHGVSSQSS